MHMGFDDFQINLVRNLVRFQAQILSKSSDSWYLVCTASHMISYIVHFMIVHSQSPYVFKMRRGVGVGEGGIDLSDLRIEVGVLL